MTNSVHAVLAGHPANPARFHQQIAVTLSRAANGGLAIAYAIRGMTLGLRIATPHALAPADALWRTTCCELFVGATVGRHYREFNFSPSGQWAAYDFLDYRIPAPATSSCPAPDIAVQREESFLQVDVTLPEEALPTGDLLHLALSVVLEADDGGLGYWALAHPGGKPDFHHHAGFVLSLGPQGLRPASWP